MRLRVRASRRRHSRRSSRPEGATSEETSSPSTPPAGGQRVPAQHPSRRYGEYWAATTAFCNDPSAYIFCSQTSCWNEVSACHPPGSHLFPSLGVPTRQSRLATRAAGGGILTAPMKSAIYFSWNYQGVAARRAAAPGEAERVVLSHGSAPSRLFLQKCQGDLAPRPWNGPQRPAQPPRSAPATGHDGDRNALIAHKNIHAPPDGD